MEIRPEARKRGSTTDGTVLPLGGIHMPPARPVIRITAGVEESA
jgi:hypothetical protein